MRRIAFTAGLAVYARIFPAHAETRPASQPVPDAIIAQPQAGPNERTEQNRECRLERAGARPNLRIHRASQIARQQYRTEHASARKQI